MGNSSTKESRTSSQSRPSSVRPAGSPTTIDPSAASSYSTTDRPGLLYATRSRGGGRDSFLGVGANLDPSLDVRKETKQEREARKAEKERITRAKERELSIKEESIDGGYLVTLGTYTGLEDFSKATVRQLMIERRIAPFWRGLNDHSESWTEHQLVAAARGLPIPAPDEIPPEEPAVVAVSSTQPITFSSPSPRFPSHDNLPNMSSSQPAFSTANAVAPASIPLATSPLFRGRSKTLASLTSKNGYQGELTPQEIRLPHEPYINGQPIEANLYKDVLECPICFLYYPPYLNKTRCCDQPICSECFVQIKRPDPHPPEHTDPNTPLSPEAQRQAEEGQLVSEPAQCPFCVQTEFGVSYEPPPFRRGLAYANQGRSSSFVKAASAMSSTSSLSPPSAGNLSLPAGRRRATSLSATAPQVITTDKVRPDWAKKLSDARAHAARRSAAATALHNAAYLMGGNGALEPRFGIGRRRRTLLAGEIGTSSANGTPRMNDALSIPNMEALLAALEGQASSSGQRHGSNDLLPSRISSRHSRTDDLEEIMLLEAIRQSLLAEEERKQKEGKEAAKQAKKDEKRKDKEQKKTEKDAKKGGLHSPAANGSSAFYSASPAPSPDAHSPAEEGKGKAKATNTSHFDTTVYIAESKALGGSFSENMDASPKEDPQRHLELSRAHLDSEALHSAQIQPQPFHRGRLRHSSDASSSASSFLDSVPGSFRNAGSDSSFNPSPNISGHHLPFGTQSHDTSGANTNPEPIFNFGSLAAIVGKEGADGGSDHVDQAYGTSAMRSSSGLGALLGNAIPPTSELHNAGSENASAVFQGAEPEMARGGNAEPHEPKQYGQYVLWAEVEVEVEVEVEGLEAEAASYTSIASNVRRCLLQPDFAHSTYFRTRTTATRTSASGCSHAAGMSSSGRSSTASGKSIAKADTVTRNALRYTISAREYALLHQYLISRTQVLSSKSPKTLAQDAALKNYEDHNAATVRATVRLFVATYGGLKAWEVITRKLFGRTSLQSTTYSSIWRSSNFRISLSLSSILLLHRLLHRFFTRLRESLRTDAAKQFRRRNPRVARALTSKLAPAVGASLAGFLLGISPADQTRITITIYSLSRALEFLYNSFDDKGYFKAKPWWIGSWLLMPIACGQLLHAFVFDRDCFPTSYGNFILKRSPEYIQQRPTEYPTHLPFPSNFDIVDSLASISRLKWPAFTSPILFPKSKTLPAYLSSIAPITDPAHPAIKRLSCAVLHPHDPSCLRTYLTYYIRAFPSMAKFFALIYTLLALPRYRTFLDSPMASLNGLASRILRTSFFLTSAIGSAWSSICLLQHILPRHMLPTGRWFLSGFLAGLWAFLERGAGRSNFLYSGRMSLDCMWKVGKKKGWWRGVKNGDVVLFVASLMAINTVYEKDSKAVTGAMVRKSLDLLRGGDRTVTKKEKLHREGDVQSAADNETLAMRKAG